MLGSISPVGEAGRRQRWWVTAAAYVVASVAGGAAAGVALGVAGEGVHLLVNPGPRGALLALAVVAAAGLAWDTGLLPGRLPTWRRQVDERWLAAYRGWVYGAGFGLQLGLGVVTIVTASLTYVAFASAVAVGDWRGGLVIGAVFGTARALPLLSTVAVRTPAALRRFHARLAALEKPADRAGRLVVAAAAATAAAGAVV